MGPIHQHSRVMSLVFNFVLLVVAFVCIRIRYTHIGLLQQFVACMPKWTYRDVMLTCNLSAKIRYSWMMVDFYFK